MASMTESGSSMLSGGESEPEGGVVGVGLHVGYKHVSVQSECKHASLCSTSMSACTVWQREGVACHKGVDAAAKSASLGDM